MAKFNIILGGPQEPSITPDRVEEYVGELVARYKSGQDVNISTTNFLVVCVINLYLLSGDIDVRDITAHKSDGTSALHEDDFGTQIDVTDYDNALTKIHEKMFEILKSR